MKSDDIDSLTFEQAVSKLRELIGPKISGKLSDSDCRRFLRARPNGIEDAAEMLRNWWLFFGVVLFFILIAFAVGMSGGRH